MVFQFKFSKFVSMVLTNCPSKFNLLSDKYQRYSYTHIVDIKFVYLNGTLCEDYIKIWNRAFVRLASSVASHSSTAEALRSKSKVHVLYACTLISV